MRTKQRRADAGQDLVEYSFAVAAIALVLVGAATLRRSISSLPEAQWEARINQQVASLRVGRVMYLIPTEMLTGRQERIVVRVSRQTEGPPPVENLPERGAPKVESIKVGAFMLARLTGDGFEIQAKTGEKQAVADPYAEWTWQVVPVESGEQKLDLTVAVRLKLPEGAGEEEVYLPVITRTVKVHVDPVWSTGQWVREHESSISGPLVVALVVAIAGLIWGLLSRRKKDGDAGFGGAAKEEGKEKGFGAAAGEGKKEDKKPPVKPGGGGP